MTGRPYNALKPEEKLFYFINRTHTQSVIEYFQSHLATWLKSNLFIKSRNIDCKPVIPSHSVTTRPIQPLCTSQFNFDLKLGLHDLNLNCDFDLHFQTGTLNFKNILKGSNCDFELQLQTFISRFNFKFQAQPLGLDIKCKDQFQTSNNF